MQFPLTTHPRSIYNALNPHPGLSPVPDLAIPSTIVDQARNETNYRQLLVQGVLAVLLPTEDLENVCLRTLVADIIAELIIGNSIGGKCSEGWFIWETISKITTILRVRLEPKLTGQEIEEDRRSQAEKVGFVSEQDHKTRQHRRQSTTSEMFWRLLQYGHLAFIAIRFVIRGLMAGYQQPPRSSTTPSTVNLGELSPMAKPTERSLPLRPILTSNVFSLLSNLLSVDARMPWLSGSLRLLQYHLVSGAFPTGATDGIIDQ